MIASTSHCDNQGRGAKQLSHLNVSFVSLSVLVKLEVTSNLVSTLQAAKRKQATTLLHVSS